MYVLPCRIWVERGITFSKRLPKESTIYPSQGVFTPDRSFLAVSDIEKNQRII